MLFRSRLRIAIHVGPLPGAIKNPRPIRIEPMIAAIKTNCRSEDHIDNMTRAVYRTPTPIPKGTQVSATTTAPAITAATPASRRSRFLVADQSYRKVTARESVRVGRKLRIPQRFFPVIGLPAGEGSSGIQTMQVVK